MRPTRPPLLPKERTDIQKLKRRRVPLTFRSLSWRLPHALPRARGPARMPAAPPAPGASRKPRVSPSRKPKPRKNWPMRTAPDVSTVAHAARLAKRFPPEQLGLSKTCARGLGRRRGRSRGRRRRRDARPPQRARGPPERDPRGALLPRRARPRRAISTDGASSSGVPTTRLPRYSGVAASATSTFSSASSAPNTPSSASARARYRSRRRGGSTASASRARWWHLLVDRRPRANIGADPRIAVPPRPRTSTATSPNGAPPDALSREPHPLHSAPHLLHSVPSPFPWRTRPRPVGCLVVFVFAWRNFRARTTSAARFDSRVS